MFQAELGGACKRGDGVSLVSNVQHHQVVQGPQLWMIPSRPFLWR